MKKASSNRLVVEDVGGLECRAVVVFILFETEAAGSDEEWP